MTKNNMKIIDRTNQELADHLLDEADAFDVLVSTFRSVVQQTDSTKEQWEALDCLRTAAAGLRGAAAALHRHLDKREVHNT